MVLANSFISELNFVEVLLAIILGWILVDLWQRCIDNFTFNTLKLNKNSTYHTFVIAAIATTIFLVFTFTFENIFGNLVEQDIEGGAIGPIEAAAN